MNSDNGKTNTEGGALVQGNVNIEQGDFIGRDSIQIGSISNTIAAINAGVQIIFSNVEEVMTEVELDERASAVERKRLGNETKKYIERLKTQAESSRVGESLQSPYKALIEYDIQDAALFFGRQKAVSGVLACLDRDQMTILHAESGAGKTSLLKAGIAPRLLAGGHVPLYLRPYQTPVHIFLKKVLCPQVDSLPELGAASLHDFLQVVSEFLGDKKIIILVDQFEEFFTEQSETDQKEFISQLAQCLNDDLLPVRWVFALRGEWLTQFGKFRPTIRNPFANEYFLPSFSREEARQVVVEPAKQMDVAYEDGLADQILDDLGGESIHPPQLQIVCSSLFEKRGENTQITQALYQAAGKAENILQGHLDEVIRSEIPDHLRLVAQRVLLGLVSSDDLKKIRTKDELASDLLSQGTEIKHLEEVLTILVNGHLLRYEEIIAETETYYGYELAHDYLIGKIEVDQEERERKLAQELLEQETKYFLQSGEKLRLGREKLAFLRPHLKNIPKSDDAVRLLILSQRNASLELLLNGIKTILTFAGFAVLASFLGGLIIQAISFVISFINPSSYIGFLMALGMFFAYIGLVRGWVKELLLSFSVILALFLATILEKLPFLASAAAGPTQNFWFRTFLLITLVVFGFYVPTLNSNRMMFRSSRERFRDSALGLILGALNGYLILGSFWYFLHVSNYYILQETLLVSTSVITEKVMPWIVYLPPNVLAGPGIYIAVAIAFIFVLIVFI